MRDPILEQYSDRALTMIASAIAGEPLRVLRSSRLQAPAALALEPRTLLLDPERVGPYDLVLLACALPPLREHRPAEGRVPPKVVAAVLRREQARLQPLAERTAALTGCYRPRRRGARLNRRTLPEVTRGHVQLAPLSASDLGPEGVEILSTTGLDVSGASGDFDQIERAILEGRLPLETHPAVPNLPFVRMPLRLEALAPPPPLPAEDEAERRREVEDFARGVARCLQEHMQGLQELKRVLPRTSGRRLDPGRLHHAFVSARTGQPPLVFRPKPLTSDATFRPERYLAVLGFDVHSMHAGVSRAGRVNLNLMRGLARTYDLLEIPTVIVAFRDRAMRLSDGRWVYLHVPCVAKAADEPFGPAVWNRLEAAWTPVTGYGRRSCLVPLQLETLERHARAATERESPRWLRLDYYSVEGLEAPDNDEATLTRVADATDRVLRRFSEMGATEVDVSPFLPKSLIRHGAPGSIVAKSSDLGV